MPQHGPDGGRGGHAFGLRPSSSPLTRLAAAIVCGSVVVSVLWDWGLDWGLGLIPPPLPHHLLGMCSKWMGISSRLGILYPRQLLALLLHSHPTCLSAGAHHPHPSSMLIIHTPSACLQVADKSHIWSY